PASYTRSLHDALPISLPSVEFCWTRLRFTVSSPALAIPPPFPPAARLRITALLVRVAVPPLKMPPPAPPATLSSTVTFTSASVRSEEHTSELQSRENL